MDIYNMAMMQGYYFDRRIDLEFFSADDEKNLKPLYKLNTPKNGIKPSITVKGTYIEGGYSVNSFISIQNMSYSVDVNSVAFIKCKMYYSGMDESMAKTGQAITGAGGIETLYQVLYADQEKEPPNRAVRFQCVVASECKEMFDIPIEVSREKGIASDDGTFGVSESGSGGKSGSRVSMRFVDYLKKLATARNQYINKNYTEKKKVLKDSLLINCIEYPKDRKGMKISLSPGKYKFGEALRKIGTMTVGDMSSPKYCHIKTSTFNGSLIVTVIPPVDWEIRAKKDGKTTPEKINEFFNENYSNDREVILVEGGSMKIPSRIGTADNPVPLNFVKAAYRSENIVFVSVMYDNRIRPGVYCSIAANAIMGKSQSGTKLFSRITKYGEELVLRITGDVEYEFSTTETGWMSFKGAAWEKYEG